MPREAIDITVERMHYGLLLSTIYRGEYYKFKWVFGMNQKEAKQAFRQYVREEDAKIIRAVPA